MPPSRSTRHHDKTLAVPVEAVSRKASCSVLVVTKDNHLENRAVDTGLETPHKIEILRGLNENDLSYRQPFPIQAGQQVQQNHRQAAAIE